MRLSNLKPLHSLRFADLFIICTGVSLPWSTSLSAIFLCLWLVAMVPSIDLTAFRELIKQPVCFLPASIFAIAVLGMLWSNAPWTARLYSIGPTAKFLVLPLLIYHFQRSTRGAFVFGAFFVSCTLLMLFSWIVALQPELALKSNAHYGVPLKNYIDQSHEFSLCAVGILYIIMVLLRDRRWLGAASLITVGLAYLSNMTFIVVSRTALVTLPIMILAFSFRYLSRKGQIATIGAVILIAFSAWQISPGLRERPRTIVTEYQGYTTSDAPTSVGLRLEFWSKSLQFWMHAPLIGHGTGSVQSLFKESAEGQTGTAAEIIANPHNQTLYMAIQWGSLGVLILYCMWLCHLFLFRGTSLAHWVGLLVVVQNMLTSMFNSHLFDFNPGWIYVLGVGVAGGMVTSVKSS